MSQKVIIITGASSGIGRSCVKEFLRKGYSVVAAARSINKLESLRAECAEYKNLRVLPSDVSREDDCKELVKKTIEEFGRIDVLINNAGVSMRALFQETDLQVLKNLMDVNFWGTVYCTKYALPELLRSKGSLVGVSSIAGKKGLPGRTGYSASKFAMEGFLETIRMENMKKGLHVLVACPGFTNTQIRKTALDADGIAQGETPRNESEMMSSEAVAVHIYKAVRRRQRDLVLTGNGKLTVFLNKFFPKWTDKLVYKHMAKEPGSPLK